MDRSAWFLLGAPWDCSGSGRGEAEAPRALADALGAGLRDHPRRRPLVVGGDCSLLLGVFAGLRPALGDVGLWSVDGHPDYLDAAGSESGETADLQLALLTGDGPPALTGLGGTVPMVRAQHAALIGHRTRNLDPSVMPAVTYPQPDGPDLAQLASRPGHRPDDRTGRPREG